MEVIAIAAATILLIVLAGVALAAALSASGGRKSREELQTSHIARQPWDAHGADGRGNR